MRNLTVEAEKIVQVVNKFGGATLVQLEDIINDKKVNVSKVAHYLALQQYLDIVDEKYVTARKHATLSSEDIDCLWAVIDSLKYENAFDYETFKTTQAYSGGESKIKMTFIKDASYIINVASISKNNIIDAVFIQNRFYQMNNIIPGQEKDRRIAHYFVTRKREVVEELKDLKLTLPYIIVLLSYENPDRPEIEYITT